MGIGINNRLFILLTDACTLGCDFCYFRDRRESKCGTEELPEIRHIDVERGMARESLSALIGSTPVIGISWGGEPLFNVENLLKVMGLSRGKRFIITTNGSFAPLRLHTILDRIERACGANDNRCIIRLSVDRFHENSKNYQDNLENLLKWSFNNEWKYCRGLFFRSNILDESFAKEKFRGICEKNGWEFEWDDRFSFAKNVKVNGRPFRIIFRPIVDAGSVGIQEKYSTYEYMDLLEESDGKDLKIGVPKGCQGCQGCKGEGSLVCAEKEGLDITIDTDGQVYVYGGEVESLGSIYEERIDYDVLRKKLSERPVFRILLTVPFKKILHALAEDESFRNIIESTNYPYCIIKNLKKADPEKLNRMLLSIS